MKNVQLRMIDSKNLYGTMNGGSVKLSNITDADKKWLMEQNNLSTLEGFQINKGEMFRRHRQALAEDFGFDWRKMFMADQEKLNGSVFEITKDYVDANPNGWTDIPEDILMMRDDLAGVALGHPVADCAVLVAEDRKQGISAVAHCGGEMIDKRLPNMVIEALYREGAKPEDIFVNVGARAIDGWVYTENMPKWATDEQIWKKTGAIVPGQIEKDGKMIDSYTIYQDKALGYEFSEVGVLPENVTWDRHNTITDSAYYSNSAASNGHQEKYGRQFVGAIYQEEGKARVR
ncbi:MAG TPA: laccase domain-containing protein [Candidatus Faecimonas intestinavium]|nr:laccase domain-containing protein [Candidatus Faecimonas intestinavium]